MSERDIELGGAEQTQAPETGLGEPAGFINLPHPRALAFLGDAVYEIFLREWAVELHGKAQSKDLHGFTVRLARATTQVAWFIDCLVRRAPTFPTCEAMGWNPLEPNLRPGPSSLGDVGRPRQ